MKVLSSPDISNWKSTCSCYQCSSKMEIDSNDLQYKKTKKSSWDERWGESSTYMADVYYVVCPMCQNELEINIISEKIPFLLLQKVRSKSEKQK